MKKLSILFIFFIFNCSAEFSDNPTYVFSNLIKSISINNVSARVEKNKFFISLDSEADLSNLIAEFKTERLTKVFVNNVEQISGVTVNDFSKGLLVYNAVNTLTNKEETYYVFVSKIILIDSFSRMIKVNSINYEHVDFDFLKAPSEDLIGVDENEVSYCIATYKIENIQPSLDTNLIDNFECKDFIAYKKINKKLALLDDDFIFNIVAKHNNNLYYYQRIFITQNTEVLNQDTSYTEISGAIIIANGHTISIDTDKIENSIILNANIDLEILDMLNFTSIENSVLNNRLARYATTINFINNTIIDYDFNKYTDQDQGIVAGVLFDEFLPSLFKNNIVKGKIIDHYPNDQNIIGGIVGFDIVGISTYISNIIEVELNNLENNFVDCIFGHTTSYPNLINNTELCVYW